jgi:hypothetical protein
MRKLYSSFGVKLAFLTLYIVSNIWAAFTMIDRDELIADHAGWPAPEAADIAVACIFVVLLYASLLFVFREKKVVPLGFGRLLASAPLSATILAIQSVFFLFVLAFGAGAAGGDAEKAGGALRFLFYIVNPDMLFLIFFGATMYGGDQVKYRRANLLLFMVSNFVRGWLGQLLVVVFIYAIVWLEKQASMRWSAWDVMKLTIVSAIGFVFASFLLHMKIALRLGLDAVLEVLSNIDFFDVVSAFFEVLFARLQMLSTVLFQVTKQQELTRFIDDGVVGSYYTDGLPQQTFFKLMGINPGENLNLFLWKNYIPGDFPEAQTTVQPGLVGWTYILPSYSLVFFVLYLALLIFINVRLVRYLGGKGLRHLSWFSIMLFLVPGWLGAYVSFLWTMLVFCVMAYIIRDLSTGRAVAAQLIK